MNGPSVSYLPVRNAEMFHDIQASQMWLFMTICNINKNGWKQELVPLTDPKSYIGLFLLVVGLDDKITISTKEEDE